MKLFNIPLYIDLPPETEEKFGKINARRFLPFVRVGVMLGFFTYPVWLIWDYHMGNPDSFLKAIYVRIAMMAFFAAVFAVSFWPKVTRFIYEIAAVTLLATVFSTYVT